MKRASHARVVSAIRACTTALLIVGLLGSIPALRTDARQASESPALELPAMVLTPTDLAAAGMPGYGVRWGRSGGPEALADIADDWDEQATDGEYKATLEGLGLRRSYLVSLYTKYNVGASEPDREIGVSLHAFDRASGAIEGLAFLDQLSATSPQVQRRESAGPITASAVLVWQPADTEDPSTVLTVAFRVDRVIAIIEVSTREGQEPTVAEAETLATLLSQRIDAGLAGNTPGLGNMAPRIEGFSLFQDEYIRRDSEDFSSFIDNGRTSGPIRPSEASLLERRDAAAGNAVEAYTVEQYTYDLVPSLPSQFSLESRIYQFADVQDAVAWLDSRPRRVQATVESPVSSLEAVTGAPTYGDQSTSVTYLVGDNLPYKVYRVFLRVGNRTADIELVSDERDAFPDTTIQGFASVQAQCLTSGCPTPIPIADALDGSITVTETRNVPVATPAAQATADLGAMALTPADLASLQMPGFGVGAASTIYPVEWMQSIGQNRGMTDDQVRAAIGSAGFLRRYNNELYLPSDVNAPTGEVGKEVITYLLEFSSDAGAAGPFDFLGDESGNSLAGDIPMSAPIGDQSEATHQTVLDQQTGEPFDLIDLTFRSGRFQAGVAIIDWQGQTVQLTQVELLAQRLLQRIQSASNVSAPGLSNLAMRTGGSGIQTVRDPSSMPICATGPHRSPDRLPRPIEGKWLSPKEASGHVSARPRGKAGWPCHDHTIG